MYIYYVYLYKTVDNDYNHGYLRLMQPSVNILMKVTKRP